jgi:hypothetical protein
MNMMTLEEWKAMNEETITISRYEYEKFKYDQLFLQLLRQCGVSDWGRYESVVNSMEDYEMRKKAPKIF